MATRVILLGGPGGAGTSQLTANWAARLLRAGNTVAVVDLDPWAGAAGRVADERLVRLPLGRERESRAGHFLDRVGLDPRMAQELARLVPASAIDALRRVAAGVDDGLDVVLVDAGSRAVELLTLADRLPWLTRRLLPAHRGWLAVARPLTESVLRNWPGPESESDLYQLNALAQRWSKGLLEGQMALVGHEQDRRMRPFAVAAALHELPTSGPLDPADTNALPARLDQPPSRPRAVLREHEDRWTWDWPLPGLRSQHVRVERSGDDVAIEVDGVRRVVTLPSSLRRFGATSASVDAKAVRITFRVEERSR